MQVNSNMCEDDIRQPRTWWVDAATTIAGSVKAAVDCVCKEWKPIRTALFQVLSRFPDCQDAVLLRLREMSEGT